MGSPQQLCSFVLRLFPLRDLTGHIISAKNILRESGRREVGVGQHVWLQAGGGGSSRDTRVFTPKSKEMSQIPLQIHLSLPASCFSSFTVTHLCICSSEKHQFALTVAQLWRADGALQSDASASETQLSASGAPVVERCGTHYQAVGTLTVFFMNVGLVLRLVYRH